MSGLSIQHFVTRLAKEIGAEVICVTSRMSTQHTHTHTHTHTVEMTSQCCLILLSVVVRSLYTRAVQYGNH